MGRGNEGVMKVILWWMAATRFLYYSGGCRDWNGRARVGRFAVRGAERAHAHNKSKSDFCRASLGVALYASRFSFVTLIIARLSLLWLQTEGQRHDPFSIKTRSRTITSLHPSTNPLRHPSHLNLVAHDLLPYPRHEPVHVPEVVDGEQRGRQRLKGPVDGCVG